MTLEQIRDLVAADFDAVDTVVKHRLYSPVTLVNRVADYIIYSGGKRLRPLLVLLAARACGQRGEQHIDAAAIIEFIHTATLLHDDVVDGSSLGAAERRPTRNSATPRACWSAISSIRAPFR